MYGFTQWLEEARGFSSLHTRLVMLPMSLAALACSLLGARTKGIRAPLSIAAVLLVVGGTLLLFTSGGTPLAGLQRTAQYIGAIAASGLIGLAYGQRADDAGLHLMAAVGTVLALALAVLTLTDRALRARP